MPVNHWWIGTDHVLRLENLRDAVTGAAIDDATVTAVLRDAAGSAVEQAAGLTLAHRAGSSGQYVGTLPGAAALQENQAYTLEIVAVAGSLRRTWRVTRTARYAAS